MKSPNNGGGQRSPISYILLLIKASSIEIGLPLLELLDKGGSVESPLKLVCSLQTDGKTQLLKAKPVQLIEH